MRNQALSEFKGAKETKLQPRNVFGDTSTMQLFLFAAVYLW